MRIYTALGGDRYELVHPDDPADWETVHALSGRACKDSWRPFRVHVVTEEHDGTPFRMSRSPWFGSHVLVFREEAMLELASFLAHYGEILPLKCDDGRLYMWHPLMVVDAVDFNASEVWRFKSGKLMRICRHVFDPVKLHGVVVFKIPAFKVSPIYYSEEAVRAISAAIGPGLEFKEIWSDSAKGPNKSPEPTPTAVTPRADV